MSLEDFSLFQDWELGGNFIEKVAMVTPAGVGGASCLWAVSGSVWERLADQWRIEAWLQLPVVLGNRGSHGTGSSCVLVSMVGGLGPGVLVTELALREAYLLTCGSGLGLG